MLAAFVAMLGKQWLNRYMKNSGGSMIERCGDRQRKCDGLEKWPLHFFVESLPVMLQVALLLLACGLCRHMWTINTSVASTLISLTSLGVAFYVVVVIAGMLSYACPFQTAASVVIRRLWKRVRHGIVSFTVRSTRVPQTPRIWKRGVQSLLRRKNRSMAVPLENIEVHRSEPWMKPMNLAITRRTNADDVQCVSWILRNITDPEALDAAIRLAGTILWFDDGINVGLPYDLIVSTFKECFDPTGRVYPGSRDRAYYSGRAMMWIRALAMCKSEEFARTFSLPDMEYPVQGLDRDLKHLLLLQIDCVVSSKTCISWLLGIDQEYSPSHLQWISDLQLHLTWANRTTLDYEFLLNWVSKHGTTTTLPLNATLNRFLVWCILLGSPVEEKALKLQDKSYDISSFSPSHC